MHVNLTMVLVSNSLKLRTEVLKNDTLRILYQQDHLKFYPLTSDVLTAGDLGCGFRNGVS